MWSAGNDGLNILQRLDPWGVEELSAPDEHGGAASGDEHFLGDTQVIATDFRALDGLPNGGGIFDIADCIRPEACAKNVLTVGAETTPVENSFYCVGPTDDGRIKPDIVASGGGYNDDFFLPNNFPVLTAVRDGQYGNLAGSSFAAATVGGDMNLALELWDDRRGPSRTVAPFGSTLKALAIASAFPGRGHPQGDGEPLAPDFRYGWGRFDATKMCSLIHLDTETEAIALSHRVIKQLELSFQPGGGEELEFCIERIGGSFAVQDAIDFGVQGNNIGFFEIQVTICWTDPPGTPEPDVLDPTTPRLVNDLDVAILGPQAPDGSWPAAASSAGTLDNVERATVNDADDGLYKVVISHKGELHDDLPQKVSAVVLGAFAVPRPLGELEILPSGVGGQHTLRWDTAPGGLDEVQRSTDLENWTNEADIRARHCITTHDVTAVDPDEFFRVRQVD